MKVKMLTASEGQRQTYRPIVLCIPTQSVRNEKIKQTANSDLFHGINSMRFSIKHFEDDDIKLIVLCIPTRSVSNEKKKQTANSDLFHGINSMRSSIKHFEDDDIKNSLYLMFLLLLKKHDHLELRNYVSVSHRLGAEVFSFYFFQ